jgi:hypothetical protein
MTVVATRYDLEEVKRTSIERGLVRMVVTPADEISVQALYRIRTARDRLQVVLPEKVVFDTEPLRINGRAVMLEKQKGDYFVPIVAPNAETPFLLEMRYSIPKNDGSRLDLPVFPQDPAAQKVFVAVYLPETKTLLNSEGPWTKESRWRFYPTMMWHPEPVCAPDSLLNWVREDINLSGAAANDFQTDGTLYLYSTLRPDAPPAGSLLLTIMDARWLQALMFLVVFLVGLLLIPARCRMKTLAVGLLITILVLLGVFYPIFAMQILNGVLFLAIFLVLVLWTVAWVFQQQKRQAAASAEKAAATPPSRDSGVDLSQYEPNHHDAPPPQTPATPEPPKPAGTDGSEGGKSHE